MINDKTKMIRNTVVMLAILIVAGFIILHVYQVYISHGSQAPDIVGHVYASDALFTEDDFYNSVVSTEADDGQYESGIQDAEVFGTENYFENKMSGSGVNSIAPNGLYTEQGVLLLSAAGFGSEIVQAAGISLTDNVQNTDKLTLTEQFAARATLYPYSPLSLINRAVVLDAPYNNLHTSVYASALAGAILYANQILEENNEITNSLSAYADRRRRPIYLTIDDGPSSLTRQYLDVLKAKGVHATFFVIGSNVKRYPDVIREIYEDGHYIANHSNTHNYDKLYQSSATFRSEIEKCESAISDALGFSYNSKIFRFPGGSSYKTAGKYKSEIKNMGYAYYDWNCLNGDAQIKDKSADSLYKYMLSTFKDQDEIILLMHDSATKQTTVEMLDKAIDFFLEKDYEFHTLNEKHS